MAIKRTPQSESLDRSPCSNFTYIRENQIKGAKFTRTEVAGLHHGPGIELVD